MLSPNASHAYLLAAIAEQIPRTASQDASHGRTETCLVYIRGNRALTNLQGPSDAWSCMWLSALSLKKIFLYPERANLRLKSRSGNAKARSGAFWSVELTPRLAQDRFDFRFAI
jgi:hypothetical protein